MITLTNITLPADKMDDYAALKKRAAAKLRCPLADICEVEIVRRSIDARKRPVKLVYTLALSLRDERPYQKYSTAHKANAERFQARRQRCKNIDLRPIVIGSGPAGLFCALMLTAAGCRPILYERGDQVDLRSEKVRQFWQGGDLDADSNVQFGEGGAGTFSDGKLTTNIKNPRCRFVLETFVKHGANRDILYSHKPHIGTDVLRQVVKSLRDAIRTDGGDVHFRHTLEDIVIENQRLKGVIVNGRSQPAAAVFLAIGHSARDTFAMLHRRGVPLLQKPFSMGVRIEHRQAMINQVQYGSDLLGSADYKLSYHSANRSVYTFCMCPGGMVVASASEPGRLVTNGMSERARDQVNANSALLVEVRPSDFKSAHPLAGIEFQRIYEEKAFRLGGSDYTAPCQTVASFLGRSSSNQMGGVIASYRPAVKMTNIADCLPPFVSQALRQALPHFAKKLSGFDRPDSLLTAIESRSSSPLRIVRNAAYQSAIAGLYPIGEGAGYAGGIMSAAVDGIKAAEQYLADQQS